MTLRTLREAWDEFFFAPQSPTPIALFRILYGLCVSVTVILLHADWLNWFGVHGWVTLSTMRQVEPGMRLNLFTVMPQDDRWIAAFFWVFLGFALLLTAGVWTRLSSIAVFLCLTSIDQRNLLILHGGDTFLRLAGFFLMFAPAGAAFSVDRLIRVRRGLEGRGDPAPGSLGPTDDPTRAGAAVLHRILVEDERAHMAQWNSALLCAPSALDRAVSGPTVDPISRDTKNGRLVHPRSGVCSWSPHLVPAISLSVAPAGPAVPLGD